MKTAASERFMAKVSMVPNGCWIWVGYVDPQGYGKFSYNSEPVYAHRFSYYLHNGHLPREATTDHLCRNRCCVNPEHLESVSSRENMLRSPIHPFNLPRVKKAVCKYGHSLVDAYVTKNGAENCRPCMKSRIAKWRQRRRLTAIASGKNIPA